MSPTAPSLARFLLIAGVIAVALAACGRRGALEPPPDARAVAAAESKKPAAPKRAQDRPAVQPAAGSPADDDDDDEEATTTLPSPAPTPMRDPSRKRKQPYYVPKEPFILDPLL